MGKQSAAKAGANEKGAVLKKQIYRCAIDLFTKNGYENVKVMDICQTLNISVGTFYYYYPSKESVFLEYGSMADSEIDSIEANLEEKTASEKLLALLQEKVILSTHCGPELCAISLTANLKHHEDSAFDLHRSAYGHFMRTIEDGIRSGEFRDDINLYTATSMLRYILGGLVTHWAIQKEKFDILEETNRLGRQFIEMLKPPKASNG